MSAVMRHPNRPTWPAVMLRPAEDRKVRHDVRCIEDRGRKLQFAWRMAGLLRRNEK